MPDRPVRIQLRRAKGWRMPENTVKVDRSTKWGNPYQAGNDGDGDRAYLVALFRDHIERDHAGLVDGIRDELRGKNLACWCPLPEPGEPDCCHAAALIEIANAEPQR